jgi:hypothetical protein
MHRRQDKIATDLLKAFHLRLCKLRVIHICKGHSCFPPDMSPWLPAYLQDLLTRTSPAFLVFSIRIPEFYNNMSCRLPRPIQFTVNPNTYWTSQRLDWKSIVYSYGALVYVSAYETKFVVIFLAISRDSTVGIANGYGLDSQGFRVPSPGRGKNFLFSTSSRPAQGQTQPPIRRVPEALYLGVKRPGRAADHSPPISAEVKYIWVYTSTPPYVFMAQCLIS